MPYSGKRKLKPIVTFMKKEIEKAKTDKAKVRYFPLTWIGMDCFIELYIVHTHAVLVYAAGGGTEEEVSEWTEGCGERGTLIIPSNGLN